MIDPQQQQIDRALHTLRSAEPRHGTEAMNRRLLARLQSKPAPAASFFPRAFSIQRWAVALAIPTAALSLVITLIAGYHHHSTATTNPRASAATTHTPQPESETLAHAGDIPPSLQSKDSSEAAATVNLPASLNLIPLGGPSFRSTIPKGWGRTEAGLTTPTTSTELSDTNLPSHPAPPMPLTRQERLLLRIAAPGNPTELAQLEPLRELAQRQAAQAHERSSVERLVQRMLAPIALSESINPTSSAEPPPQPAAEDTTATPDPDQP